MDASFVLIAILRYLGNPAVFFAWYWLASESTAVEQVLGAPAFEVVDTAVVRMNFVVFVACTAPVYLCIIGLHALAGRAISRFNAREFFRTSFGRVSLLLTIPGLLNLWSWCSDYGMEMNIMGILVAPTLLLWTLFTFAYWRYALTRGFGGARGVGAPDSAL